MLYCIGLPKVLLLLKFSGFGAVDMKLCARQVKTGIIPQRKILRDRPNNPLQRVSDEVGSICEAVERYQRNAERTRQRVRQRREVRRSERNQTRHRDIREPPERFCNTRVESSAGRLNLLNNLGPNERQFQGIASDHAKIVQDQHCIHDEQQAVDSQPTNAESGAPKTECSENYTPRKKTRRPGNVKKCEKGKGASKSKMKVIAEKMAVSLQVVLW